MTAAFSSHSRDAAAGTGPLSGVRVVELGGIGPPQFGGMVLADHGADVGRIERQKTRSPFSPTSPPLLDRGKRLVPLDLREPAGTEVARRLVAHADVLIEGFRPGVA